jgi:hypothetical protein
MRLSRPEFLRLAFFAAYDIGSRVDTTQIYTHVSIRMLKQIHSATHPATHPAAQLKRNSEDPEEAVESAGLAQAVPGQMWPGVPAPTAEELFADGSDHPMKDWQTAPIGLVSLDIETLWFHVEMDSGSAHPYMKQ